MTLIRSTSNPLVKRVQALASQAKARREAGLFVAEGPRLVREALKAGLAKELVAEESAWADGLDGLAALAGRAGIRPALVTASVFKALADTDTPQGVLALARLPEPGVRPALGGLALALDGIQDPGNLGTLLRGAWAGACDFVLLSPDCADPLSPKALRAGAGAQLHLALPPSKDLAGDLAALAGEGAQVVAAAPEARAAYTEIDYTRPTCLVVGAEGPGLKPATLAAATHQASLRYPGAAESLNAAVAGHVFLFEALRQRQKGLKTK